MSGVDSSVVMANFDRASRSYDQVSSIQKQCCHEVLAIIKRELPDFLPKSILDVGAGTGYLTKSLLSEFPDALYTITDISNNMLNHARATIERDVSVILGDMNEIQFPEFDMIVSSMAIHWSSDPATLLRKMCSLSRVFAFSILIQPSLREWHEICVKLSLPPPGLSYLSFEEVKSSISNTSPAFFTCAVRDFKLQFASPKEFMKYMRQLGTNYSPPDFTSYHVKKILKYLPGEFSSNYSVMFGLVSQEFP